MGVSISTKHIHASSQVAGHSPVVNTPNAHSVAAIPAFGPKGVADVSRKSMIGLVKTVTPQLKRLNFCRGTVSKTGAHMQCALWYNFVKAQVFNAISLP